VIYNQLINWIAENLLLENIMWNGRYMVHFDNPEGVKPLPYERRGYESEMDGRVLFDPEGVKPLPYERQ